MFSYYNPNPVGKRVGDCAVRAVSKALDVDWKVAYALLTANGIAMGDMPSSDSVINAILKQKGFKRAVVPNTCPDCYTAGEFARDHPYGVYVLKLNNHVVAAEGGKLYDTWDSGGETVIYYWYREEY